MAAAFAPLVAEALAAARPSAAGRPGSSGSPTAWWPPSCRSTGRSRSWPTRSCPALLAGNTVVVKAPPTCPGTVLLVAAAMAAALPPGVLNVVNGPDAALGRGAGRPPRRRHGVVHRRRAAPAGRHGRGRRHDPPGGARARRATTRPSWPPTSRSTPGWPTGWSRPPSSPAGRSAWRSSGSTSSATGWTRRWRRWPSRLSAEVVGDGLADGVTMGPGPHGGARDRVEAFVAEAEAAARPCTGRPGCAPRTRRRAATSSRRPSWSRPRRTPASSARSSSPRRCPVIPYDDIDEAVAAANDTAFGLCASVWSNDEALAADVAARLRAGTVFVNAHGMSRHGHVRADGRVEAVRLRARARAPRACRPSPANGCGCAGPGPAEQGEGGMTVAIRGGTVVDGTGATPRRADVVVEGDRVVAVGPDAGDAGADTVIDADGPCWSRPGFVDLHTHYDAQLFWDPNASPSPLHGVTTVLGGNCGFSLAPAGARARRLHLPDDGPGRGHAAGRAAGRAGLGLELLRRVARPPRRPHRGQRRIPGRPLHAAPPGHGGAGRRRRGHGRATWPPWWPRCTPRSTRVRSVSRPRRCTRTTTATASRCPRAPRPARRWSGWPPPCATTRGPRSSSSCRAASTGSPTRRSTSWPPMSLLADRPVNWNVLGVSAMNPDGAWSQLAAGTAAAERGATVVALTLPHTMQLRLSFEHGAILDGLPGWREVFACRSTSAWRRCRTPRPAAGWTPAPSPTRPGILRHLAVWDRLDHRGDVRRGERRARGPHGGRRGAPSGAATPFDALLDVVVADGLRTGPAAADRRVRGGLGAAGPGLAGPAGHRRRVRRRRPPRHHVRRHLLDLDAGRRRAGARAAELGAGRPPADRHAGPALRPARPGPAGARAPTPTSWCSTRPPSATAPCAPATTCPAGPAGSTPRRSASRHVLVNGTEIVRDGDVHRRRAGAGAALGHRHRYRARRVGLGRRRGLRPAQSSAGRQRHLARSSHPGG